MEFGIIRLDWSVARHGYDLVELPKRKPGDERSNSTGGTAGATDLTPVDQRNAFQMVRDLLPPAQPSLYVLPRGREPRRYTAHVREKNIFLDLASMEKSSAGVLAFVHEWGLLDDRPPGSVSDIIDASRAMERRLKIVKEGGNPLGQVGREAWAFPLDGEFRGGDVIVRVKSLRAFCWLEFRQAVGAGGDFYRCGNPRCAVWHRYPTKGRPNKYCSEACKKAAHRARKKSEAPARAAALVWSRG